MSNYEMYCFFIIVFFSALTYASNKIDTKKSSFHKGEDVIACGTLAQMRSFSKGIYLNMDKDYPQQSVTFLIWSDDFTEFQEQHGNIKNLIGERLCAEGLISDYKGRNQIVLYNSFSLRVE